MKEFRVWDIANKKYLKDEIYLDSDGVLYKLSENQCLKLLLPSFYIVEHYTGRKDKNGVKIFEGDTVSFYSSYHREHPILGSCLKETGREPYVIVYRDCNFAITSFVDNNINFWLGSPHLENIEIICTVHELEGK